MPRAARAPVDLARALLDAWATNAEVTRYLLEHIAPDAWTKEVPGGKGRTIASAFAHIHNVRHMLLVMAKAKKVPPKLDRHSVTPAQARAGLAKSAEAVAGVLEDALAANGRVPGLNRDVPGFVTSAVAHEAHCRGQICMRARELGLPLSQQEQLEMWEWGARAKAAAGRKS